MRKTSYLFLANGFEEIEALTTVDILRRAGIEIETVSITDDKTVAGAHGITVLADKTYAQIDTANADWLIIPGGLPGSTNLHEFTPLNDALKAHFAEGGNIAAICAAPAMVLAPLGILDNREATGYPGSLTTERPVEWRDAPVVTAGNVVTGNGPASAMRFALAIVAKATEDAKAQEVGSGLLFYPRTPNLFI